MAYPSFNLWNASALFPVIIASFSHEFISGQLPHVSICLLIAHCRIGHSESQKGVFTPGILHPTQLIISAVIPTPFSSDHSLATRLRSASSLFTVARRASHALQSKPQYAINSFMSCHLFRIKLRNIITCKSIIRILYLILHLKTKGPHKQEFSRFYERCRTEQMSGRELAHRPDHIANGR